MKSRSWVVIEKSTGKAICETFDDRMLAVLNKDKYTYLDAYTYLTQLNKHIRETDAKNQA